MKLQSIQALRGLAALLVVFFHIRSLELKGIAENGLTEHPWVGGLFTNGYAGVDLFFVISGFIMVFVTSDSDTTLKGAASFLFARVTRIYPVWWAFATLMTIYMVITYGVNGQNESWAKASNGVPLVPYLVKSFFLQPQPALPILNVGWTLVHEMYFYLVFSVFMLLPRRFLPGLLGVWALIVIAGTFLGYTEAFASTWLSLAIHPMTIEFILGAAAGLIVTKGGLWRNGTLTLVAILWLLVGLCYQGAEDRFQMEWGRVLWFGLPCSLLIYGVAGLDLRRRQTWLIPALAGFLVTLALFQMTGLDGTSDASARLGSTILTVTVGGIAMLVVLWSGWLLGQDAPRLTRQMTPLFRRLLAMAASLGDWSFALYLCHILVLSALRRVFKVLGQIEPLSPVFRLGHSGPLDNIAFVVLGVTLCLITSWMTYRWFERPSTILFGRLRKTLFREAPAETAPA